MSAPNKIYLPWEYSEIDVLPPGVTTKQVSGKDVCYIRKDFLLELIEEEEKFWDDGEMIFRRLKNELKKEEEQ